MKEGTCKNYSGLATDSRSGEKDKKAKCGTGVVYLEVARPLTTEELIWHLENYPKHDSTWTAIFKRLPCHAENGLQDRCPHYCEPTTEELAEQEAATAKMVTDYMTTRKAITDYIKEQNLPKSCTGRLTCPICEQGEVLWSRASNGHIHARCTTAHCVEWME